MSKVASIVQNIVGAAWIQLRWVGGSQKSRLLPAKAEMSRGKHGEGRWLYMIPGGKDEGLLRPPVRGNIGI